MRCIGKTILGAPTLTPDSDGVGRNREEGGEGDEGGEALHFVRLVTDT